MLEIHVNASDLDRVGPDLTRRLATILPRELLYIQSVWFAAVQGLVLPGMRQAIHDERYAMLISEASALEYPFNSEAFRGRIVMLDGALAGRYEHGYRSFDMKPGLLAGPHARTSKDGGRYNIIPFTHSTPGSRGQKGAPMPPDIYALAKQLQQGENLKLPADLQNYGQRSKVPAQVNAQALARQPHFFLGARGGPMFSPYTWKASPYAGMTKSHREGHTTYQTYRVVSSKSDPSSWIHPGQAPNPVIESVLRHVQAQVVTDVRVALGAR